MSYFNLVVTSSEIYENIRTRVYRETDRSVMGTKIIVADPPMSAKCQDRAIKGSAFELDRDLITVTPATREGEVRG